MTTDDNKLSVTAHWNPITGHYSNAFLFSGNTAVLYIRALLVTQIRNELTVADEEDPTWRMTFSCDYFEQTYDAKSDTCRLFKIGPKAPDHPDLSWTCHCGGDMQRDDNGPWFCQDCNDHWDHETRNDQLGNPGTYRYNLKYLGKGADL